MRKIIALRSRERMRMCEAFTAALAFRPHPERGRPIAKRSGEGLCAGILRTPTERAARAVLPLSGGGKWYGARASSRFHRPALEREHAARPFLDEEDDQHQDGDLAEHRAGDGFEEFVGDAEHERADQRAP